MPIPSASEQRARKRGPTSQAVGPSPVDRGRGGTKRHVVVDRNGLPLATVLSGANVPDGKRLFETVDAIPSVKGKPGRPRKRPDKLDADKAYDDKNCGVVCGSVVLCHDLPAGVWKAARSWGDFAGLWSARLAGNKAKGGCDCVTNGAMIFTTLLLKSRTP